MTLFAETKTVESYLIAQGLSKAERLKNAQVAQDFLSNDKRAIQSYLTEDLKKTFKDEDIEEFQYSYVNLVPKILKRISLLYKTAATRLIPENKTETEKLNSALTKTGYDRFMRDVLKGAKLHNTVLMGALPDGKGSVRHVILRPDLADVEENPNNYLDMISVKFPTVRKIQGKEEIVFEYYSKDEYKWFDINDAQILSDGAPIDNEGHPSPGTLNFVAIRLEDQNDFWGDGMGDLIDANRIINFLMTSALVENIIMSAFGQMVAINLGLTTIRLGPKHPIIVDGAVEGDARPGLENVSGTPHTEEIKLAIDWLHKLQGMIQGLPASSFSETEQILSGYAKMVDSLELLEEREADALVFRPGEIKYLEIFAKVWNNIAKGEKKLPENLDNLKIDFAEIIFPETQQERTEKWRARIEMGIANQIDWIMEGNPDMTREDAKKKYLLIQKENQELKIEIRGKAPDSANAPDED